MGEKFINSFDIRYKNLRDYSNQSPNFRDKL